MSLQVNFHITRSLEASVPLGEDASRPDAAFSDSLCFGERLRIRLVLADDHPVIRDGLSHMITKQGDIEVIGQAADGEEAVKLALELEPDIVLMDVTMPVLDGIKATRQITSELPQICVIGLSMHEDPEIAREMIAAGAARYITKSASPDTLLNTIRACTAKS